MRPPSIRMSAVVTPAATAGSHQACTSARIRSFSVAGKVGLTGDEVVDAVDLEVAGRVGRKGGIDDGLDHLLGSGHDWSEVVGRGFVFGVRGAE